ncbi:ATP-binding protein [Kushneria phosphatilytica]|uniref:histidine kinase n=1 Tax=Kushneria phosphatilytica TaxID=657387 RepID=A0A1S1NX14_9GAMM|nr:ATP-binding protein [Kushneria phosphatilytica]OHV11967.1 two-component sensor histidine kinase [Kushneria phosphatilytica]QEL11152.1 HAMP domain-containing histidine kinase [Kushneria phosphatilytica]
MPQSLPLSLPLTPPSRNLIRLTIARGITWTGFLGAVIFGIEVLGFQLHVLPIIGIIVAMGLFNIATWWRLGRPRAVTDIEYLAHLLVDITGLTVVFHFTGGATNPAITYYLLPVSIAAATLPWRHTWITAAAAMAAYTLLMVFFEPIPELSRPVPGTNVSLRVLGMWLNFALCAGLITWLAYKMAQSVRQRDRALSRTRESALRSEQILAVASQAAGTAHELGTPLSTMAVLLSEMREEAESSHMREDIDLLRQQVDTCKGHLRRLAASAERRQSDPPEPKEARQWLGDVLERWLVMRPDVSYQMTVSGENEGWLLTDISLDQAVMNLFNNAADANPENIEITLQRTRDVIIIDIRDHGAGVPIEIADQLGDTFISSKSKGMGIGLFLTHATVNRFGGSVTLYNHEDGGTLTEVSLPRTERRPLET